MLTRLIPFMSQQLPEVVAVEGQLLVRLAAAAVAVVAVFHNPPLVYQGLRRHITPLEQVAQVLQQLILQAAQAMILGLINLPMLRQL
jgi:hypothetical protein